jgi:dsDNA-specific endonuclease/ATPase MutS2
MALKWKKRVPLTLPNGNKIQRRIKRLDSSDLLDAIDLHFAAVHDCLALYHKDKGSYALQEIMNATEALYVITEELEIRRREAELVLLNQARRPSAGSYGR